MDMQLLKSEYIISEGMDKIKWFLFKNLQLGVNYYEVKYERSIPFLLMLPSALKIAH